MIKDNILTLLPSPYAKEAYIKNHLKNGILDTCMIKTIYSFYSSLRFKISVSLDKRYIGRYESVYILKEIIENYNKNNKGNIFSGIPLKNDFINELYSFYEETTLMYAQKSKDEINCFLTTETSMTFLSLLDEYNKTLEKNSLADDNSLYIKLTENLRSGSCVFENIISFDEIILDGFEILNIRYAVLLSALSEGFSIGIIQKIPFAEEVIKKLKNEYGAFDFFGKDKIKTESEISFSKITPVLINTNEKPNQSMLENISFMSAFGTVSEVSNVLRTVLSLIEQGVPSYSICVVLDNTEKYHTIVIDKCIKMKIPFVERRGEPLWNITLIPLLMSMFVIRTVKKNGAEIDVDTLSKILSSDYISLENVQSESIRSVLFGRDGFNLYLKMNEKKLFDKLSRISLTSEHKGAAKSVLDFLQRINLLMTEKSLEKVGAVFLSLLSYVKIHESIKQNKETYMRDNNALAVFIECVRNISQASYIFSDTTNASSDFFMLLNDAIRKAYMPIYSKNERGITVSTFYDARNHAYDHVFILGMNKNFLQNPVSVFILGEHTREKINRHFKESVIISKNQSMFESSCLFANIIASSLKQGGKMYLSFQYKNEKGDTDIPSSFIEELFYKKTGKMFTFENLKEDGMIYPKEYIPSSVNALTEEEAMFSLFYRNGAGNITGVGENECSSLVEKKEQYAKEKLDSIYKRRIANLDYDAPSDMNENEKTSALSLMRHFLDKTISVSDLENLMLCPAKFLDEKIFAAKETEISETGINKIDKGVIYHSMLERFFSILKNEHGMAIFKKNNIDKNILLGKDIAHSVFKESRVLYDETHFDVDVMKNEALDFMNAFVQNETMRFEKDNLFIPTFFETKFENYAFCATGSLSVNVNGRIDRLDIHYKNTDYSEADGVRIVDYKAKVKNFSGKANEKASRLKDEHLQLMLYMKYIIESNAYKTDCLSIAYASYDIYETANASSFSEYSETDLIRNASLEIQDLTEKILNDIENGIIEYRSSEISCKDCKKRERCPKVYVSEY